MSNLPHGMKSCTRKSEAIEGILNTKQISLQETHQRADWICGNPKCLRRVGPTLARCGPAVQSATQSLNGLCPLPWRLPWSFHTCSHAKCRVCWHRLGCFNVSNNHKFNCRNPTVQLVLIFSVGDIWYRNWIELELHGIASLSGLLSYVLSFLLSTTRFALCPPQHEVC